MKKIIAIWLCCMLVLSTSLVFLNVDAGLEEVEPAGGGADLVISNLYTVSGSETWNNVTVTGTGKLIVPAGATFNVTNIDLQSGSVVEATGGDIVLSSMNHAADVRFSGTCCYFNVSNGSNITMVGSDGYADTSSPGPYLAFIPTSKGGDAELNVTATEGLRIDNSIFNLAGGNGFDLPASTASDCNAWANGIDIEGYIAAGGNVSVNFNLTSTTGNMIINNYTLNATAGSGGKAADGGDGSAFPGKGGGHSSGGIVSGHVGAGGRTNVTLTSSRNIYIDGSNITSKSGKGSDTGEGGNAGGTWSGGGGGGYGGGKGGAAGASDDSGESGVVDGFVGCGGIVEMLISAINVSINESNILLIGNDGGPAGNGGNGFVDGGGGGGGFGGGGGTGRWFPPGVSCGDGQVTGFVSSGGNTSVVIKSQLLTKLLSTSIFAIGGNGGHAGNGGNGYSGGPFEGGGGGGAGYAGGGGAGDNGIGGDGFVSGAVGKGGYAKIYLSSTVLLTISTDINIIGGNGGDGGVGGSGPYGGGGGGGYGGAGGGGGGAYIGGSCTISGDVGNGGNADLFINSVRPSISIDSNMVSFGGVGGTAPNSPGGGPGGEGEGRITSDGTNSLTIPMGIPFLLSPSNNSFTDTTPTLEWLDLHNSTTNGQLSNYTIQIDNNNDFSSPEATSTTTDVIYSPPPLTGETYYWRVKAEYSSPSGSTAGWSDVWVMNILQSHSVLLVNADTYNSTLINYYIWPLQNCSVNITVWDVYGNNGPSQGKPNAVDMSPYDAVFWVPDIDMSWSGVPFDNTDEIEVATYLNNGGNFFLSNIQYTLFTDGGSCFYSPGDFAYDYLGLDWVNGWSINEYSVNATVGDPAFGGIGPCIQDWNVEPWWIWGGVPPWMSDDVYPGLGTICFFNNDGFGWQEPAGIRYDGGNFKTIFFGFPLETLSSADANVIMNRTMTWFGSTSSLPQMTISKNAPATANPGETILYTITYQNVGTDTAYNVTITDTYPAGVTFIDSNPAPTVGNNTWIMGDVPAGSGGTIYVNVSVELWATGTLMNWVDLDYEDVMGFPQPTESDFAGTTVLLASGPVHNIDTDEYFLTINEGINDNDTLNGHTLEVASGVYNETVDVSKELNLIGEDRSNTIINMGIDVNADNVLLTGFTLTGAGCCNHMSGSNINITRNNFTSNPYAGIWLFVGSNYYITENEIHANVQGIYVSPSCNNVNIYHNNFIDNLMQAEDFSSINFWDDGYPSGGNYWSDYNGSDIFSGPLQDIPGSDGIGDTPYFFDFNQDDYPLMAPWNSIDLEAPVHSNEYPGINMGTEDQSTMISVHVTDNVAVNVSSIRLYVMGFPVFYDLTPIPGGYNISYTHMVDYPEGQVFVRIVARDTSDNLLDFTWTFYVDLSPPEAWDMDPPPGGVTEDTTPTIQLNVTDISSGVVLSTMRLYVQGFPVLYDYYTITNGFHIYYTHLAGFASGEFVQCRILAEDHSGHWLDYSWNFTIADVLTVQIPVQVGWNLISFPLIPDNTSLPVVLQDLDGDTTWENIQWYDPLDTADHWKTYATFKPPFLNDLTDVTRSMSVWLYVPDAGALGDGFIKITGSEPVSTIIPLYAGWNLVGYPSLTEKSISDALVGTGYDGVEGFNATAPYLLSPLDDTYMMKTFEGYWIHVPIDTVWVVDW